MTSIIENRQTHHLVREGAPQKQDRNSQTIINIWSWAPDGARHQGLLIDWPSVTMWLWLWLNRSDRVLIIPRGGRIEYLHRKPASLRRRRKGKSRIWESKIGSRVPRDSDSRMTALARASSNCKRQTRSLVRESAPHRQACNCLSNKDLVLSPRLLLYSKTDWPTEPSVVT
jgi:hypothetical protein